MRAADVLVLPSFEEGSALVTYEARAAGCVLAVSDRTGAPATHGHDALVHPAGDVAALQEHLGALHRDVALREGLRRQSVEGAGELTWAAAAEVLAGLLRRGARPARRRRAQPVTVQGARSA